MAGHDVLARLLPMYMTATTRDKGWQLITGFVFSAVFNALYLGILAAGVTLGIRVAL